jgi:hypothetical protein
MAEETQLTMPMASPRLSGGSARPTAPNTTEYEQPLNPRPTSRPKLWMDKTHGGLRSVRHRERDGD